MEIAMNERERIGLLVAEKRMAADLSIRELSAKCEVPYQNITKIEKGKYNASVDLLSKICSALGCKIDIVADN